jgi:hypothetical protein
MRIDPEDIRRRYAVMSDEELLSLDPAELSQMARPLYEQELASRNLNEGGEPGAEDAEGEPAQVGRALAYESDEPAPDWLDEAACVCTFAIDRNNPDVVPGADRAREALEASHIPCYLNLVEDRPATRHEPARHALLLMVPGSLVLPASSILDRDVLNAEHEAEWRAHLEGLSDEEIRGLNPDIICAGLLDRAERLRKVYREERAARRI